MIRLSVVIPTFNDGHLVARAAQSVGAGDREDVEVVVVDDGSTGDTPATLQAIPGVRVLRQKNRGPGAARNRGVREARGALVAFLDADDRWLPGKLDAVFTAARGPSPPLLFYSGYRLVTDSAGACTVHVSTLPPPQPAHLLLHNLIGTSTVVTHRDRVLELGGFRTDLRFAEDWDLWLRLLETGPAARLPGVLVERHERSGTLSDSAPAYLHDAQIDVLESALARQPHLYRPVARRARANIEMRSGIRFYRSGDRRRARAFLTRALVRGRWRPTLKYLLAALRAPAPRLEQRAAAW